MCNSILLLSFVCQRFAFHHLWYLDRCKVKIKQLEFHDNACLVCYYCLLIKKNAQALLLILQKWKYPWIACISEYIVFQKRTEAIFTAYLSRQWDGMCSCAYGWIYCPSSKRVQFPCSQIDPVCHGLNDDRQVQTLHPSKLSGVFTGWCNFVTQMLDTATRSQFLKEKIWLQDIWVFKWG